MNQSKLFTSYLRLTALKSNLPGHAQVHEKYLEDFHAVVDLLAELSGLDLDGFRLPSSECLPGEAQTAADRYCERSLLTQKIDAVLSCFQVQFSPPGSEARGPSAPGAGQPRAHGQGIRP
jgi:hypothetical protein